MSSEEISYLINGLLFIYLTWVITYTKKTAELTAVKKSLAEMTTIAESIKKEFANETEKLKSLLQVESQLQFSIKNESIKAIVESHRLSRIWIDSLNQISIVFDKNDTDIRSRIIEVRNLHHNFKLSCASLQLYIQDQEFLKRFLELNYGTLQIQEMVTKGLLDYDSLKSKYFDKQRRGILTKNDDDELIEFTSDFSERRMALYHELLPNMHEMSKMCFEKINYIVINLVDSKNST